MALNSSQNLVLLQDLYEFITDFYNLDEIRTLCFELGINFENLAGETRNRKARGLVIQLGLATEGEDENCTDRYRKLLEIFATDRPAFYPQLFKNLPASEPDEPTSETALVEHYCAGLDQYIKATRPLHEKALSQLGLEQRVGTVAIILLLMVFGLAAYLLWRQIRPEQMGGDFNIAVAPFQVIGAEPEIGEDVANSIYGRLSGNFEGVGSPIVAVWGPGEPVLNPVPVISGRDDNERDLNAARLAADINADIVVYGVIDREGTRWQVTPKFYVSPDNFENAFEILGPYDLGETFGLTEGNRRALRITSGDELTPRSEFLTQVAIGLTYYTIANYERAAETFLSILPTADDAAVTDEGSLRLVYLLLGNTYLRIAQQEFQDFTPGAGEANVRVMEKMNQILDEAELNFSQSAEIDPDYARAYLGLGDVAYLQSVTCDSQACTVITEPLTHAKTFYEQALDSPNAPVAAVTDAKANFGLGQVYFRQSLAQGDRQFAEAVAYFTAVLAEYDSGSSPRARDIAAEAQARLGLIACFQGNYDAAVQDYQEAIHLYTDESLPAADHIFTSDVRDRRMELYEQRLAQLEAEDNPSCSGN